MPERDLSDISAEERKPVNIAFVSTGYGPLWAPCVASWLQTVAYTARYFQIEHIGKIGGAGISDRMYTMTAQNCLVKETLANPSFTHLFMTEMDMVLPYNCIVKLLALDKDMASGIYFLRSGLQARRGQPCLYKKASATEAIRVANKSSTYMHSPLSLFPRETPFQVDCSGLGCVLFKREVFERLPYPWFDLKAGSEEKIGYGSDMYFYTHARQHGLELWADPTVQCGQIDYYETDISDYQWQLDNNPSFAGSGFIIGMGGNGNPTAP
jgi:hypothetical protein